jgi:hypothetical protein
MVPAMRGLDDVVTELVALLDLHACWFEPFPFDAQLPRIEPGSIVLPAAEPGIAPWRVDNGVELPVRFNGLLLGRFVLAPRVTSVGVAFPPRARDDAITIAEVFAAALAREWGYAPIA